MNRLAINTSNDNLFIVLEKENDIFFKRNMSKMHHNETMLPLLDELLKEHNLDISDINEFGVCIGPGSFTGIRVGVSTIKAFRDSLKAKAKGINNLDYLFELAQAKDPNTKVVAILGSKDSYFVAREVNGILYKYEHNLSLDELKAVAQNQPIGMFKQDENLKCLLVEDNAEIFLKCLNNSKDETLVPVYYQLSQAENEKLKKINIEYLDATTQDAAAIENLEKAAIHSNHLSTSDIDLAVQSQNYKTFVAKIEDEIVAYVILQITDEINIVSIAVDKVYRNLGIATKLISKAEAFAKENKVSAISLEVASNNISAFLLYEKLGFKTRRIRKNYYEKNIDCFEMVKEI